MRALVTHRLTVSAVLSVLLLGEIFRSALSVTGWALLPVLTVAWAALVVWRAPRIDTALPIPLRVFIGWIALTPLWSPYPATAVLGVAIALGTVLVAYALTRVASLDELLELARIVLRWAVYGSLVFEIIAALIGSPIFKVGQADPDNTPRELAWSRAELFNPDARIQGLPGNANILAILTILFLILTVVKIVGSKKVTAIVALDLALAGFVFVRTESATAILALLAAAVVGAIALVARRGGVAARVTVWGTGLVAVAAAGLALANFDRFTALLGKSPDLTHRFDIWNATIERIVQQPVVGHGFVGFWPMWEPFFSLHSIRSIPVTQAHNAWLDIALQAGAVGVVLFAVVLVTLAYRVWGAAIRSESTVWIAVAMILTVQLVQSVTESRLLSEWGLAFVVLFAIVTARPAAAQTTTRSPKRSL
jgi:O-antigen ligase